MVCDEYTTDEESEAIIQLSLLISSSFIINCSPFLEEDISRKLVSLHGLSISKLKFKNMEDYCNEGFAYKDYDPNAHLTKFLQGVMFVTNGYNSHMRPKIDTGNRNYLGAAYLKQA